MSNDLPDNIDKEDLQQLEKRIDHNWKAVRSAMLSFLKTDKKMNREDKELTRRMRRKVKQSKSKEKFKEVMSGFTNDEI